MTIKDYVYFGASDEEFLEKLSKFDNERILELTMKIEGLSVTADMSHEEKITALHKFYRKMKEVEKDYVFERKAREKRAAFSDETLREIKIAAQVEEIERLGLASSGEDSELWTKLFSTPYEVRMRLIEKNGIPVTGYEFDDTERLYYYYVWYKDKKAPEATETEPAPDKQDNEGVLEEVKPAPVGNLRATTCYPIEELDTTERRKTA